MYCFIVNSIAGKGRGIIAAEQIDSYLKSKNVKFELKYTQYAGHAVQLTQQAVQQGYTNIIAVGGDGTINEVLNGIDVNTVTMGVIPAGSGNDFCREEWFPKSIEGWLDAIISGTTEFIDFGVVNGKRFINIIGTGLDVDILYRTIKYKKIFSGPIYYYLALIVTLFKIKFRSVTIKIDDQQPQQHDIMLIAVANGKRYGGNMHVAPKADIQDGLLDLCIVNKLPKWKVPFFLIKFLKGNHLGIKYIDYIKCKKLNISGYETKLDIDGDLDCGLPCDISVHSGELKLFVKREVIK